MISQRSSALAMIAIAGTIVLAGNGAPVEMTGFLYPSRPAQAVPVPPDAPPVVTTTPAPEPAPQPPPPVVTKKPEAPKPKAKTTPKPKPAPRKVAHHTLPSCEVIRREYARMSFGERMTAYGRATPAEVVYGKRCLGM